MSDDNDRRFYENDVLKIRNNTYEVESVDIMPNGGVLQYRLNARSPQAPPATLKPNKDGYTVKEYHNCNPTVIE